jgi:diguanylate cyclase (GGDEF)-like protein
MNLTTTSVRVLAAAAPGLAVGWGLHALAMRRRVEAARLDPLTGLATRTGWARQAEQLIGTDRHAVVLLLDLDRFKQVNDTHGHWAGDAVLVATAARLSTWCGSTGVAGRLGGDEFVAAISEPVQSLERRVLQLRQVIAELVPGLAGEITVSASIGFVRADQVPDANLGQLLQLADAAMYRAKVHGFGDYEAGQSMRCLHPAPVNGRRWGRRGTTGANRSEVAA